MNVISYNLRGVALENLEGFLRSMGNEFNTGVILIQEFTKAIKNPLPQHLDGWLVIADASQSSVRVPGAAVCPALANFVNEDPLMCGDDVVSFFIATSTAGRYLLRHGTLGRNDVQGCVRAEFGEFRLRFEPMSK